MTDESIADDIGVEIEDAPEIEAEAETLASDEVEGEAGSEEGDDQEQPETVEEIEFDFFGNKRVLPKGAIPDDLAAEIQGYAKDFEAANTRKTQAIAEQTKQVQAQQEVVVRLASLQGDAFETFSHGLQVKAEVEQLSAVDLNALWQSNPDQARRISDTLSAKQAQLRGIQNEVAQKEQAFQQAQQQDVAKRVEQGESLVKRMIPDFDPAPVMEYAMKQYGVSEQDARTWQLNPVAAAAMHKAMKYDQMQAKAKAAQPVTRKAQPVAPMKGKGKPAASDDPGQMTAAAMAKYLGLPG